MNRSPRSLPALVLALLLALAPIAWAATVSRGKVVDLPVTGSAAVFSSALTCAGGRPSGTLDANDPGAGVWWNITIAIKSGSSASKVYLREIIDADTTRDQVLFEDAELSAGQKHGVSVEVHPDHTYNVVLGTSTTLTSLMVSEEP